MGFEDRPIGFFDSGVGGISVLKQAIKVLPKENFVYFGDSLRAPYGIRPSDEVERLTFDAVKFLLKKNVKALVIACNTATSVSIEDLRKKYADFMPVVGIEPALKPAVQYGESGKVIIMATPVTLSENKFGNLMKKYDFNDDVEPMPCPGLVELIESGVIGGEKVERYLKEKFLPFKNIKIAAVVLGCTHYPFIKGTLNKVLCEMNENPVIIDGSIGTVNQLKRQLLKYNMISNSTDKTGRVEVFNSLNTNKIIDLSYRLLHTNEGDVNCVFKSQ
ncbi:glutamate racemase [Clostridium sp. LBM24168]